MSRPTTCIRVNPELKRLAVHWSTKSGCPLREGSFAWAVDVALREWLLRKCQQLRNVKDVKWE